MRKTDTNREMLVRTMHACNHPKLAVRNCSRHGAPDPDTVSLLGKQHMQSAANKVNAADLLLHVVTLVLAVARVVTPLAHLTHLSCRLNPDWEITKQACSSPSVACQHIHAAYDQPALL